MKSYSNLLKTIGTIVMIPGLIMFALYDFASAGTGLGSPIESVLEVGLYAGLLIFFLGLLSEAKTPWQKVCVIAVILFGVLALFSVVRSL